MTLTTVTLTCISVKMVANSVLVQLVDPEVPADLRQDATRVYLKVPVLEAVDWVPGRAYRITVEATDA